MRECPTCQTELNASKGMTDVLPPQPGDLTICAYCGTILAFDTVVPVRYRIATAEEQEAVRSSPVGQEAIALQELFTLMRQGQKEPHQKPGHA